MTYYDDRTPPSAYTADAYATVIDDTIDSLNYTRMKYALYDDSTTFDAWKSWAQQNAYDGDRAKWYSGTALEIIGFWETIEEGDFSFMCIEEATSGAVCVEAVITGSPASSFATRTWRMSSAAAGTKLDTSSGNIVTTLQDFDFDGTSITSPALTEVAEDETSPANWKSFQVMNCDDDISAVRISCRVWVPNATGETELASGGTDNDGGYKQWKDGDLAVFYWFDGRDVGSRTVAQKFIKSNNVTLKLTGAESLIASTAAIAAAILVTF